MSLGTPVFFISVVHLYDFSSVTAFALQNTIFSILPIVQQAMCILFVKCFYIIYI